MEKHMPHQHGHTDEAVKLACQLERISDFQTVHLFLSNFLTVAVFRFFAAVSLRRVCEEYICAGRKPSPAVLCHLRQLKNIFCREGKEVYYKAANTEGSCMLYRTIENIMEITCPQ